MNPMIGSHIAIAMATALFKEHLSSINSRDDRLLSAVRHSDARRQEFAVKAEAAGVALAEATSSGDEEDALWCINFYKKSAKTGIDPYVGWHNCLAEKVSIMLAVRQLKNDARRLKSMAYTSPNKELLILSALNAPTSLDFKEWAKTFKILEK